jgi:uncharacterized protein YijF (DUF1287 family)
MAIMNTWDKMLMAIITLAIVALLVASPQSEAFVVSIGQAIANFARTITGVKNG